ncbi:hypothetical protein EV177_005152 [Coemansia sp. RSA 1804]|nr:hypothetical protein EV177_005152 [Coemansia sp. RSA 1804]
MHDTTQSSDSNHKPKGILKKSSEFGDKDIHLRWDEDNIRITEAQKDAKMKVDEPKTPYIRYNPDLDADIQEMEDLKLASDMSSVPSSIASSPKKAQIVAPTDWVSSDDDDEAETEAEKAKHERFRKMRQQHYHLEGKYVHSDNADFVDSDQNSASDQDAEAMSSDDDNNGAAAVESRIRRNRPSDANDSDSHSHDHHPLRATKGFVNTYCSEDANTNGTT